MPGGPLHPHRLERVVQRRVELAGVQRQLHADLTCRGPRRPSSHRSSLRRSRRRTASRSTRASASVAVGSQSGAGSGSSTARRTGWRGDRPGGGARRRARVTAAPRDGVAPRGRSATTPTTPTRQRRPRRRSPTRRRRRQPQRGSHRLRFALRGAARLTLGDLTRRRHRLADLAHSSHLPTLPTPTPRSSPPPAPRSGARCRGSPHGRPPGDPPVR